MANLEQLYVGQGKVYLAPRTASGQTGGFVAVGDADALSLSTSQTFLDHMESMSGNRATVLHIPTATNVTMSLNIQNWSAENLAKAFYGSADLAKVAGTVTGEAVAGYAGSMSPLKFPGVSAVVVKKGAATMTEGADYALDAKNGTITFTADGAYLVDYAYAGYAGKVEFLTQTSAEYVLRFEGVNVADGGTPVIVTLHRVSLDLSSTLPLISTDVATLTIGGGVLADATKPAGTSQYVTIVKR